MILKGTDRLSNGVEIAKPGSGLVHRYWDGIARIGEVREVLSAAGQTLEQRA